jgi:uncharacterized membrane protein
VAFYCYVINLTIVLSPLPLVPETQVGTSSDSVYSYKGWETGGLLGGFLIVRWGGSGFFGSIFDWVVWELVVGYVICRGVGG